MIKRYTTGIYARNAKYQTEHDTEDLPAGRLTGHINIARALRHHARHPDQTIAMVTSTNATTQ